jgi:hypothetical protein
MVTSATKEARFVQPPEVEPCGLEGVEDGASVGVGGVVAAGGGVVAVGETTSVGVGPAGVFAAAVAVAVSDCEVPVGFCGLADVEVGVDAAAMAWVGTGVARGGAGLAWVVAGWPAGASVSDALCVGAAVGVLWPAQAASKSANGNRKKNRFILPKVWGGMEAV